MKDQADLVASALPPLDPLQAESERRYWESQYHPDQWQALHDIADLLNAVRTCYSLADYRAVHQRLGSHIARVDSAASTAKDQRETADDRLRRLSRRKQPVDPAVLKAERENRERADFEREFYLRLAYQYRTVGDAIAWQLFDFDALPVLALGMNSAAGTTAGKAGATAEEAAVEDLWRDRQAFALRHDYTNALRIWDLSVFSPGEEVMIYEVKANPTKGPTRKQRSLASTAVRLVRHRVTTGSDGKPLLYREQRRGAAGKPRTNLPLLVDAINGTVDVGIGFAANSYLAVTVIDLRHPRIISPDDEVKARLWAIINDIPAEVSSPPCTDRLVANSTMKQLRPSYGVPYSIYPFPPKWAASLVTGYVRVHVRLNTAAITEAFHAAGFEADCLLSARGARLQAVAQ